MYVMICCADIGGILWLDLVMRKYVDGECEKAFYHLGDSRYSQLE
jgi:hypothetical protein